MLPAPFKRPFAKPDHRFALFVVLGLAVIVLPLAEAWRRQGLELRSAFDARRALASLALAVQTQQALTAHRPYAAAVLAGRSAQEPERLRRQQAVDNEVGALVASLEAERMHRALDEADQLRTEWTALLEGIGGRQMRAAASDAAHELLVEQLFVIMDLTAGASGLLGQTGRAFRAEELTLALQTLPRLAATLAPWSGDAPPRAEPDADDHQRQARRVHARQAARAATEGLAALDATEPNEANEAAPDPALVRALVALRQSATDLAESTAVESPTATAARHAHAAGIEATTVLIARLDAGLAQSMSIVRRERLIVGATGLLALCMAAFAAALALPRGATSPGGLDPRDEREQAAAGENAAAGAPTPAAVATPAGAESEGPTSDLLLRLRRRQAESAAGGAVQPKRPAAP